MKTAKKIWIPLLIIVAMIAFLSGFFLYRHNLESEQIREQEEQQEQQRLAEEARVNEENAQAQALRQQLISGDFGGVDPKIVFLTFDDGPNDCSNEVLDILKSHDVKATFFTNGREGPQYEDIYRRIVNEGHVLANHTYSHNYSYYNDTQTFLNDVKKQEDYIRAVTGTEPVKIFRFPGGSNNTNMTNVEALMSLGYNYYDWTASAGDGSNIPLTPEDTYAKIMTEVREQPVAVVLCHAENPAKVSTRAALDGVINDLKAEGYTFMTLDPAYSLNHAKYMIPNS